MGFVSHLGMHKNIEKILDCFDRSEQLYLAHLSFLF